MTTKSVALALDLPTSTTRRALEDLAVYGLLHRDEGDSGDGERPGKPDFWEETAWWRKTREAAFSPFPKSQEVCTDAGAEAVPEMSEGVHTDVPASPCPSLSSMSTSVRSTTFRERSPEAEEDGVLTELDRAIVEDVRRQWGAS